VIVPLIYLLITRLFSLPYLCQPQSGRRNLRISVLSLDASPPEYFVDRGRLPRRGSCYEWGRVKSLHRHRSSCR